MQHNQASLCTSASSARFQVCSGVDVVHLKGIGTADDHQAGALVPYCCLSELPCSCLVRSLPQLLGLPSSCRALLRMHTSRNCSSACALQWVAAQIKQHGCSSACCDSAIVSCACAGSGHRMFLISTKELAPAGAPAGRAQEFVVLGATGNGKLLL